ncbi:BamA/TamA family outer membrane protein [Balneolaceae bacterium ANBcel3]|nr:BamA/TamA family outer membrane protein [Balneolaceae bacterium ANBcel3]
MRKTAGGITESILYVLILFFFVGGVNGYALQQNRTAEQSIRLYENEVPVSLPSSLFQQADSDEAVKKRILQHYAEQGYFNAHIDRIEKTTGPDDRLDIYVLPGSVFSIGTMDLDFQKGQESLLDEMIFFYGEGDTYSAALLDNEMRRMVQFLESKGYMLASIQIKQFEVDIEESKVHITAEVRPGERLYVDRVVFRGARQTSESYLETASGIRSGHLITPQLLSRGRRNLENTELFHFVHEGELLFVEDNAVIMYEVEERRANQFDVMFGYAPRQGAGADIVGRGHLLLRNAVWNGSALSLLFERFDTYVTRFNAGYEKDWILDQPLHGGIDFRFYQQDTLYQSIEAEAVASYRWNPQRKVGLHLRQQRIDAGSHLSEEGFAFDGTLRSVGIRFEYDDRNSRLNPTTGYFFSIHLDSGIRTVSGQATEEWGWDRRTSQQRVRTTLQRWIPVFNRQVAVARWFASWIESPHYMDADLERLGGANSLRGYREEQFRASRMSWGDIEYRYLLDPHSHAFLFAAAGVYESPGFPEIDVPEKSAWLYSGGLGFRYRTPVGRIQFTYAVSSEDPLYNGKVHFSLMADF